ncbi:hypothetical protein AB4254_08535 [Vibrio breoganii]
MSIELLNLNTLITASGSIVDFAMPTKAKLTPSEKRLSEGSVQLFEELMGFCLNCTADRTKVENSVFARLAQLNMQACSGEVDPSRLDKIETLAKRAVDVWDDLTRFHVPLGDVEKYGGLYAVLEDVARNIGEGHEKDHLLEFNNSVLATEMVKGMKGYPAELPSLEVMASSFLSVTLWGSGRLGESLASRLSSFTFEGQSESGESRTMHSDEVLAIMLLKLSGSKQDGECYDGLVQDGFVSSAKLPSLKDFLTVRTRTIDQPKDYEFAVIHKVMDELLVCRDRDVDGVSDKVRNFQKSYAESLAESNSVYKAYQRIRVTNEHSLER